MRHRIGCALVALAAAFVIATPAQAASWSSLEAGIAGSAYGKWHAGDMEQNGNNCTGQPWDEYASSTSCLEWCAEFVTWVLKQNGIAVNGDGRPSFNYRIARAWAYYGAGNGGYVRDASSHHNAMVGDLLVDNYDGTANAGGHISIVVGLGGDPNDNYVWTIGGNESNGVRLQKKSLDLSNRELVTLGELRHQKTTLWHPNSAGDYIVNVGSVSFDRFFSDGKPSTQVTKVVDGGTTYKSGSGLGTTFTINVRNSSYDITDRFAGNAIYTTWGSAYSDINRSGVSRGYLTQPNIDIDYSREYTG